MKCCFAARRQVGKVLKRLTNDWAEVMDGTDEKILELLKGNARMSYQELGDAIGMSRVAAKKACPEAGKRRHYPWIQYLHL